VTLEEAALMATIVQGVVSVITIVTVLISIACLYRKSRETTGQSAASVHANVSSTYQAISVQAMELDKIFFEHPELKPYFYDNAPPPEEQILLERIKSLAELHMDFMDMALVQVNAEPEFVDIPFEVYIIYFKELLASSPIMRDFYREYRQWYSEPVRDIADVVMKK